MGGGGGKGPQQPSGYQNVTQTQNTAPWSSQQPYLQQAFGQAQNLFQNWTPQYYPQSTVSPITNLENQGIGNVGNAAQWLEQNSATDPLGTSMGFTNALMSGGFPYSNPAMQPLANMSNTNIGTNNPGTGTLENLAGGNVSGFQLPQNALTALGMNNAAYSNPAFGSLAGLASGGAPGVGTAGNLLLEDVKQRLANHVRNRTQPWVNGIGELSPAQRTGSDSQLCTHGDRPHLLGRTPSVLVRNGY